MRRFPTGGGSILPLRYFGLRNVKFVRLGHFFLTISILDKEIYRGAVDKAFNLIAYEHVDFLLCDKRDSLNVRAVEFDDWTHQSERRKIKDAEKTYSQNSANTRKRAFL